ncbi:uncharacterized protein LOC116296004 [Actinia tenebrosa]|uniref:Uncharacterized protein LOC116296004 n=1 Tax=Actinia tenebrosa TaxID=6105 RepID=A0A6P8HWS4_ACTTE|nr:uncharacterized protein LOC116296004 [Actinia tenebrosa]XP_031559829.1 uncharacterized protein LOC116296004 [Actinia tenebrosa]XP_031559830.1 uncharacterized protein LOC116296004 [Actinia tenebrosa]
MVKLYTVFQDKKTIKNAAAIFAVVAFEQVVSKYGINCRNALLWLLVPPCVLFVVTLIKSKNVLLLMNSRTSKEKCLNIEMIGHGVAAFLYMFMPSIAWVISAFLNSKIWICYRAGFDECGVVRPCTKDEEFAWHRVQREAKSEAQNFGLLLLTGSVITLAIITWGNHLLCARPVKERELNELVREATRSELERFVITRAKERLEKLGEHKDEEESGKQSRQFNEKEVGFEVRDETSINQSLELNKVTWLKTVDKKIDTYLDEYLSLGTVKMIYPEV